MTTITPEIRHAIEQAGEEPVQLTDTETNSVYVIVRADIYDRCAICHDFDIRDAYPLMDQVAAREGWDDPAMDIYDEFQPLPNRGDVVLINYPKLVIQRIGTLSASPMSRVHACLKAALDVT